MCQRCNDSCQTCEFDSLLGFVVCISCQPSYYLDSRNEFKCTSSCIENQYPDTDSRTCKNCSVECVQCTGPLPTDCQQCNDTYYLYKPLMQCITTCPGGYVGIGRDCLQCKSPCKTCNETQEKCLTCVLGTFYHNNGCYQNCLNDTLGISENMWGSIDTQKCEACNEACSVCKGPLISNCQECKPDYYLQRESNTCYSVCPQGFYNDTSTCLSCDFKCATCKNSATECYSCKFGFFYFGYNNENVCIANCSLKTTYYGDSLSKTCKPCAGGCQACFGPSLYECTACRIDPDTSIPYYLYQPSKSCLITCPTGYARNATSNMCVPCDETCLTCSQTDSAACTSCPVHLYLNEDKCVPPD